MHYQMLRTILNISRGNPLLRVIRKKQWQFTIVRIKEYPGISPDLSFRLLGTESNTVLRKVYEALFNLSQEPELNDKEECKELDRFLVKGSV